MQGKAQLLDDLVNEDLTKMKRLIARKDAINATLDDEYLTTIKKSVACKERQSPDDLDNVHLTMMERSLARKHIFIGRS